MSLIWNNCLSKLENEIPSSDFSTWIRPLQPLEKGEKLKLLAPNQFIIDHIKEHFLNTIEDAVYEFSNGSLLLDFEIGSVLSGALINPRLRKKSVLKKTDKPISFLNKAFTFDRFVEGKCNQIARAAAIQVSENIGQSYNPLFIYGHSGLGKTHLMHAIGNAAVKKDPTVNVVYLHSEKFVQDMVQAFQNKKVEAFKKYYRSINILLIDDIQFLAGKERSQEEFFHTFNNLLDNQHQIVLTCDKYPKEIKGLEERLKSRFGWGLPIAIEPPDLDTRAAILIKKASLVDVNLPQDVAVFIGKRIPSNVRELEGALRRVIANAKFTHKAITIDFIKEALHDLISLQNKAINMNNIQQMVAEYFEIRITDLSSKTRKQTITRPRQIAMCLARELTHHSLPEIGQAFGGRDHTTVINACKRIDTLKASNLQIAEDYQHLLKTLSH